MVFEAFCSCTMWNRIRKKVLKSRNYELQQSNHFHDLEDEDDDDVHLEKYEKTPSPHRENRHKTNGFTKCLIPHISSNPISCACKRNLSPDESSVPEERSVDKPSKDIKREDKNSTRKSNSLTIGSNLNFYFKETDSCELVRKAAALPVSTKPQKVKVTVEFDNKKQDNHASRTTSMKEKNQTLPLFSAGQRDVKSGIDFKEFQRVFENTHESITDAGKTVTFETFGKPVHNGHDVKPPMFLPVKRRQVTEDSLDPSICESSLLDGSLSSSSKGASLTSEEGVESGYGTQDDGPDRLARSISSSSESNAPDFSTDFGKIKCQISRESTGEEDVFHHISDSLNDKTNGPCKVLSIKDDHPPVKPTREFRQPDTPRVTPNMNIVVAEVHAENSDEPGPCGINSLLSKFEKNRKHRGPSPKMDDEHNNNRSSALLLSSSFDINRNPKGRDKAAVKNHRNDQLKPVLCGQGSSENGSSPKQSGSAGQTPTSPKAYETDSDEDDIKEYLPADINSMSEVFNTALMTDGVRHAAELYASVPRQQETDQVIETITTPPAQTIILPPLKIQTIQKEKVADLKEKRPSRPDLIDCHDRTPTPPPPPPPEELIEFSDDDTVLKEDSIVISDDGDSGPPLPSRNYDDTLTKDGQLTKEEKMFCDAPTLVMRQKSSDTSSSGNASPKVESVSSCVAPEDEIVEQEEPIHMTWEEVMKEAKSLGIPLSPPTVTQTLSRRSSTSSQGSSCTPIASPVVKRPVKVKRSQSECKKRSPFKEKLQSLFTLRKSKVDVSKTLSTETKERYRNRRSLPSATYERGCGTTQREHREHSTHIVKPCMCGNRSEPQRVTSPNHYNTYYTHRKPHHYGTHHHHGSSRQHMNVSINVSVVSSSNGGPGGSPEFSVMSQSMDAMLDGGSSAICPGSPMSQSMIEGGYYPTSPMLENGLCPGSPMSRSATTCNTPHSMSNQSLSQQSILSGQSAPSYYRSQSATGQLDTNYHSSQSTCSQSAHSYHSAHSIGSPTAAPLRSTPTKGGTTSPVSGSPLNGMSGNHVTNGNYGTSGQYGTNGTIVSGYNGCYGTGYGGGDGSGGVEVGSNADFISSLLKLKDCGWYWGPLGWDDAEGKLSNKADGSFLVRDSSDDRYILSLSFRSQGTTHHTRIEHYKGMFSFYSQPKSHGAATIVEFIEKAMEHSRNGKFLYFLRPRAPGLLPAPVQLLYPVSRLQNMQSLHHMCRFVILKQVRKDHIDRLPIPPRLKEYLKQNQYYTEYLGCDAAEFQRY